MPLIYYATCEIHCDETGCERVYYGPTGANADQIAYSAIYNDDWSTKNGKWYCDDCTRNKSARLAAPQNDPTT
jgi:hypothetical protein